MLELGNRIEVNKTVIPPWTKPVDGMFTLYGDTDDQYRIQYTPNVVYATRDGQPLHLQVFNHWSPAPGKKYPTVLHIRGSGWMKQDIAGFLPQLTEIARCGYVVASMEYRSTDGGHRFPAQVEDAKAAIHYLKEHAEELDIDPDRIAVLGDSSGGHTALMAGFTGSEILCRPEQQGEDLSVRCIVDFFGLTDLTVIADDPSGMDHVTENSIEARLLGAKPSEIPEACKAASPVTYITQEAQLPPTLIVHGDRDDMVPFRQSVLLYEKLKQCGQSADFIMVRNGAHGARIWTSTVMDTVKNYLAAHL